MLSIDRTHIQSEQIIGTPDDFCVQVFLQDISMFVKYHIHSKNNL